MGNLKSTPSTTSTKYDVFLNFRGEDTQCCFTDHLYKALCGKQIRTFTDNQLKRGDEISPALFTAIEESKISVVIFSKNYASSKWERLENCGGLACLQKDILSTVLNEEDLKLDSPTIPQQIKERLSGLRVFIVLDDVDDFLQLKTLARGVDGLSQRSRIIITSRDKHVFQNRCVNDDKIYEVGGINRHEALQLFCNYAFKQKHPIEDFKVLSNELVNYAKGNPLALKVLGLSLNQKNKQEWESAVDKLRTNFNRKIFDVLKISYDGSNDVEKDIFLDIACFLKGKGKDYVAKILDDC
ncbi:hypothetical protein Ddye_029428 [Dipteronia dyeriana]|uniref:TIR domain-containing protein n=1 Tax=Dipteronia dyeriana TaxID=168575 RepID=A0AAD9WKM9_9ROSI|nr:hypothetical protein Ddye_029428 [Dipteronia dyeriana]